MVTTITATRIDEETWEIIACVVDNSDTTVTAVDTVATVDVPTAIEQLVTEAQGWAAASGGLI